MLEDNGISPSYIHPKDNETVFHYYTGPNGETEYEWKKYINNNNFTQEEIWDLWSKRIKIELIAPPIPSPICTCCK